MSVCIGNSAQDNGFNNCFVWSTGNAITSSIPNNNNQFCIRCNGLNLDIPPVAIGSLGLYTKGIPCVFGGTVGYIPFYI